MRLLNGSTYKTARTLNLTGLSVIYVALAPQVVMILTRKHAFWRAVPVYGEFSLYHHITSFAFCGMAVLLIGMWILLHNLRLRYIAMTVAGVIGCNILLETMITYANVPDGKDLIAGMIGVVVHLGLLLIMARFGFGTQAAAEPSTQQIGL